MLDRDDIIRMARQAGGVTGGHDTMLPDLACIERFAALVAAHEREECAKVCLSIAQEYIDTTIVNGVAVCCAAAIRARGQT